MIHPFLTDFGERRRQVRHYLSSVAQAEREAQIAVATRIQEGRLLALRAGTFLILYNLVEATTRAAIAAIHDNITTNRSPVSVLTLNLRKEVIRLFKKGADPARDHTLTDFPADFVAIALDQAHNLAGIVDARLIRQLGVRYGFSCQTTKEVTRDGVDLLTIKNNRNDLAHGTKTFEEVGRDYTSIELLLLSRRSMHYMNSILNNVARYLDGKDYLENPER